MTAESSAQSPLLQGPYVPTLAPQLAHVLQDRRPQRDELVRAAARGTPWFKGVHDGRTADGYPWLCVLEFVRPSTGGQIFVAIPGVSGRPASGPLVDRSPQVYAAGEVNDEDVAAVLVMLIAAVRSFR